MTAQELAVNGGPKTVKSHRPFQIYRLRRGLTRSIDLLHMLPLTARGITSIQDGSGIVGRFEQGMCQLTGCNHALAMNSGTASLHSAMVALGVGPGTEVIVPAYTWHASATPIVQCGATPVFCDIEAETLTACPDDIEAKINERTRAVCVVHIWGNPARLDRIREICDRRGVALIEDCSHAHGGQYQGRGIGAWGEVGCFSLQGSKVVEGGEAGVATTDDPELFDRMCLLGQNVLVWRGQRANTFPDFGDISLGVKYRPHPAAMYLAKTSLGRLADRNLRAARAWKWIKEELADTPSIRPIAELPAAKRGGYYAFAMEYRGEAMGGPDTETFVSAVEAEGSPLQLDQFRGRLLHQTMFFSEFDRRTIGGGCYDPTRPYEEQLSKDTKLPVSEDLIDRLVKLPLYLYAVPEDYVRSCARAIAKVAAGLVPSGARVPEKARPDTAGLEAHG
ncbi:MAG: DegT/DnrJ/EryC1/StrS family aminotransferase [Myxococcota bacterium]|nr:DegT/DnrJ/EryC1/StrS family aminotransferase [Myxococcota bacterium]